MQDTSKSNICVVSGRNVCEVKRISKSLPEQLLQEENGFRCLRNSMQYFEEDKKKTNNVLSVVRMEWMVFE